MCVHSTATMKAQRSCRNMHRFLVTCRSVTMLAAPGRDFLTPPSRAWRLPTPVSDLAGGLPSTLCKKWGLFLSGLVFFYGCQSRRRAAAHSDAVQECFLAVAESVKGRAARAFNEAKCRWQRRAPVTPRHPRMCLLPPCIISALFPFPL